MLRWSIVTLWIVASDTTPMLTHIAACSLLLVWGPGVQTHPEPKPGPEPFSFPRPRPPYFPPPFVPPFYLSILPPPPPPPPRPPCEKECCLLGYKGQGLYKGFPGYCYPASMRLPAPEFCRWSAARVLEPVSIEDKSLKRTFAMFWGALC